jgi:hypothetical protein
MTEAHGGEGPGAHRPRDAEVEERPGVVEKAIRVRAVSGRAMGGAVAPKVRGKSLKSFVDDSVAAPVGGRRVASTQGRKPPEERR